MTTIHNRNPALRPRRRCYRAEMHDDRGEGHMFYFLSSGIEPAWRAAMAEADAKFMSLYMVEYISAEEFISQTDGI